MEGWRCKEFGVICISVFIKHVVKLSVGLVNR